MAKKQLAIEVSKEQIEAKEFKALHRHSEKSFTRDRRLPFSLVLVLVLVLKMRKVIAKRC